MGRQQGPAGAHREKPNSRGSNRERGIVIWSQFYGKPLPTFSGKCSNVPPSVGRGRLRHWRAVAWAAIFIATLAPSAVRALDAVNVSVDAPAIDLIVALDRLKGDGDRFQVSTAADPEGIVRRVE